MNKNRAALHDTKVDVMKVVLCGLWIAMLFVFLPPVMVWCHHCSSATGGNGALPDSWLPIR